MNRHFWAYFGLGAAGAFLTAFEGLLVSGKVPIPLSFAWIDPALVAALIFITTQLPKLAASELAAATTTTTTTTSVPVQPAPEPEASPRSPAAAPVVASPVTPPVKKG